MTFSTRNFIIVYPAHIVPLSMEFTGAHIQYPFEVLFSHCISYFINMYTCSIFLTVALL